MKLCVTTVVDENYTKYIPLFVYCCNKAYPNYHIKIFTLCKYPQMERAEIIQNYFPGHKAGFNTIALRFLIPKEEFKGFDYVYITDIDIMIMAEKMGIIEYHTREMKQTKLCYSNSTRNKYHWKGDTSLSGLHFCEYSWFGKVEDQAKKYLKFLKDHQERREFDGHMLYNMCKDSKLGIPGKYKLIPRHHGIHLGNFRLFNMKKSHKKRIPPRFKFTWLRHYDDINFREMVKKCNDDMVKRLDGFCGL